MSRAIIRNSFIHGVNMADFIMGLHADNPAVQKFRSQTTDELGGAWWAELTFRFGAPECEVLLDLFDEQGNRIRVGGLTITDNPANTTSDQVQ